MILNYGSVLVSIVAGYIQPGIYIDKVVPNATTTKKATICGSKGTIEIDFESEKLELHDIIHYKNEQDAWAVKYKGSETPNIGATDMLGMELRDFISACTEWRKPRTNALQSGVHISRIVEALRESAAEWRKVEVDYDIPTKR